MAYPVPMLSMSYPHCMQWCFWNLLDTSNLFKRQTHRWKDPSKISKIKKHRVNWRAAPPNFGLTSRSGVVTVGVAGSKRPRCRWTKFLCHATFGEVGVNIERRKKNAPKCHKKKKTRSLAAWCHNLPRLRRVPGYIPIAVSCSHSFGPITELRNAGHSVPLGGVAHDMDRRCKVQDIKIEMRAGVHATCQDGTTWHMWSYVTYIDNHWQNWYYQSKNHLGYQAAIKQNVVETILD